MYPCKLIALFFRYKIQEASFVCGLKSVSYMANCIICEKVIKDSEGKSKGQDSIYCEGSCQGWLHRTCAGVPKPVFQAISLSQDPFLCVYCKNIKQEEKITNLESTIQDLRGVIDNLTQNAKKPVTQEPTVNWSSYAEVVQSTLPTNHLSLPTLPSNPGDRKYNIVVYGIQECAKGSSRHIRLSEDTGAVVSLVEKVDDSIPAQSIRDCVRLGKYDEKRHRPILVKLSRTCEVSSILAGRKNLRGSPGFSIKPDMTKAEREIEATLLKKRWELIESGIERKDIKIKGNTICVKDKKYGSVLNSVYKPITTQVIPIVLVDDQAESTSVPTEASHSDSHKEITQPNTSVHVDSRPGAPPVVGQKD